MPSASALLASGVFEPRQYEEVPKFATSHCSPWSLSEHFARGGGILVFVFSCGGVWFVIGEGDVLAAHGKGVIWWCWISRSLGSIGSWWFVVVAFRPCSGSMGLSVAVGWSFNAGEGLVVTTFADDLNGEDERNSANGGASKVPLWLRVLREPRQKNDNLKILFAATTYKSQLIEHVLENMLRTTLHNASLHPESQLKGYHFEPRLKECSSKVHLKVSPKAPKTTNIHAQAAPGGNQLQTAWQKPQAAKRHTL
ncbi:hypothetical protein DEO72_LG1g2326 [Vigna unguiculata]|uniref:Uncharacterized protein n=1 Tax=Vigna unguiculata TaxID=3917 RepID=A0A4D6KPT9_VIGUN|nr:hypothetical protein DEO72_LG1g2326 [Vigna unguiculata]